RHTYIAVAAVIFGLVTLGILGLIAYLVVRRIISARKDPFDQMKVAVAQSHVLKVVEEHNDRVLSARAKKPQPPSDDPHQQPQPPIVTKGSDPSTDAKEKQKS
ncbi:hypothetical protein PFISCL1PPCAC_22708, partial [Pristionchus fissidentatus]